MSNSYSIFTAATPVPCLPIELEQLQEMLRRAEEDEDHCHGFTIDNSAGPKSTHLELEGAYLYAEENGTVDELPADFLLLLGQLMTRAGMPWLELGCAQTCSRLIPGTHGGLFLRLHPDGAIEQPWVLWNSDPNPPERPPKPSIERRVYQHYKGGLYYVGGLFAWNTLTHTWDVVYQSADRTET